MTRLHEEILARHLVELRFLGLVRRYKGGVLWDAERTFQWMPDRESKGRLDTVTVEQYG